MRAVAARTCSVRAPEHGRRAGVRAGAARRLALAAHLAGRLRGAADEFALDVHARRVPAAEDELLVVACQDVGGRRAQRCRGGDGARTDARLPEPRRLALAARAGGAERGLVEARDAV